MGAKHEHYDSLCLSAATHALANLLRVSYRGDLSGRVADGIRDDVSAAKRAIDYYRAESVSLRSELSRERRRVRQLRRAVLAWAGRFYDSRAYSCQVRAFIAKKRKRSEDSEALFASLERYRDMEARLTPRARDRSKDDAP